MLSEPPNKFPITIKRGYATVKIYQIKNRGNTMYTLAYSSPHGRVRENVSDLSSARRKAADIAGKLTREEAHVLELNGQDKRIYVSARSAVAPTGIALDIAARQFAVAYEILGRDAIVEAAHYFKKHVDVNLPNIPIAEAVEKFYSAKTAEGMSQLYLKDIRLILGDLASAFHSPITSVVTEDLRLYLNQKKIGSVARNNRRRLIVALFNFAKGEGWLPKAEATAADGLGAYKVKSKDVQIFAPEEVRALIKHAKPEFMPWVALIAFGGVRREELKKGLAWEDINFSKRTIIVPAGIAKTGRKRKIEMASNLFGCLAFYRSLKGPIFNKDPRRYLADLTATSGVTWKVNALRHSFGSYRMEQTKNAGQVALEMGNSPSVVMEHYFEIVDASKAKAYWAIIPKSKGSGIKTA